MRKKIMLSSQQIFYSAFYLDYSRSSDALDDQEDFLDEFWVPLREFKLENRSTVVYFHAVLFLMGQTDGEKQLDRMLPLFRCANS